MSIRDGSAVGRFHGAAASNGQAILEKEVATRETRQEGGCHRWLRKACPCCFRRQNSSYDVTSELDVVGKDEEKPTPLPEPPQPSTGDSELEGETPNSDLY